MKRMFLLFSSLMMIGLGHSWGDNKFSTEQFQIDAGNSNYAMLQVNLEVNEAVYTAFQMDVWLPKGIEVYHEGDDYFVAPNESRIKSGFSTTHTMGINLTDKFQQYDVYRVTCYSGSNALIKDTSGTMFNLPLFASDKMMACEMKGFIRNAMLVKPDETAMLLDDAEFAIIVNGEANVAVTITYGYASFASLNTVSTPVGLKAYTGTYSDGKLWLTEIADGIIPACTGVILAGENGDYSLPVVTTAADTEVQSELTGVLDEQGVKAGNTTIYVLAYKNSKVAFYKADSNLLIPYGKAYLETADSNAPEIIMIEDRGMTGISTPLPIAKERIDVPYNLKGQRTKRHTKGINVINGKKIIVK